MAGLPVVADCGPVGAEGEDTAGWRGWLGRQPERVRVYMIRQARAGAMWSEGETRLVVMGAFAQGNPETGSESVVDWTATECGGVEEVESLTKDQQGVQYRCHGPMGP